MVNRLKNLPQKLHETGLLNVQFTLNVIDFLGARESCLISASLCLTSVEYS